MKIRYDINEEIDRIESGNTVYIAGLHGIEFKFINNKYGKVKNLYVRHDGKQIVHVADIELLENKKIYSVNLDFIYKISLDVVVDNVVQHIMTIDNPFIYYVRRKQLISSMSLFDEFGQYISVSNDKTGKSHVILFSGIN